MCNLCYDKPIPEFSSVNVFDEFKLLLNEKLKQKNGLQLTKDLETDTEGIKIYKCENCQSIWWLASPKKNVKGFFIRDTDFTAYLKNTTRFYKMRTFIFIVVIVTMIIMMIVSYMLNH